MAKKLNDKEISQIIAKFKTGGYTQRELAKKYGVSNGNIAGITNGISKDNKNIVDDLILSKKKKIDERVAPVMQDIDIEVAKEAIEKFEQKFEQIEHNGEIEQKIEQLSIEQIKEVLSVVNKSFSPEDMFNNSIMLTQHAINTHQLAMLASGDNFFDVGELSLISKATAQNKEAFLKDKKFYEKPNASTSATVTQTTPTINLVLDS